MWKDFLEKVRANVSQAKAVSLHLANGVQNLGVIALGLGLFEGRIFPLFAGSIFFMLAFAITWRVSK